MTATEIINLSPMDIAKMSTVELREAAAKVFKAANQRARRLEKSGKAKRSPAYRGSGAAKGFHMPRRKGKTPSQQRGALQRELSRATGFLRDKTSTARGLARAEKTVTERFGRELTKAQLRKYWSIVNRAKELGGMAKAGSEGSPVILDAVAAAMKGPRGGISRKGVDEILAEADRILTEKYEQRQATQGNFVPF